MERVTIKELKAICYPPKKRLTNDYLFLTFLIRRISIYFTFVLIRLKITANQVSLLSLVSVLVGCYLLSTGHSSLVLWGAILMNVSMLFDCVDGEIARYRGPTKLGGFLEGIQADFTYALLLPSIAVGLYRAGNTENIAIVTLAFAGAMSKALTRSLLRSVRWSTTPSSTATKSAASGIERILSEQFYDRQEGASSAGRILFLLWTNMMDATGFLLPLIIVAALANKLRFYVQVYSILYILVYIGGLSLGFLFANRRRPQKG